MKERLDPLIVEGAPWLFRDLPYSAPARTVLMHLLGYDRTLRLGEKLQDQSCTEIMDHMGKMLARDLSVIGLDNVPRYGPAMIVCNHPTGIADGIMLYSALSRIREDLFIYANSDILRVLPQMKELIAPVEWRREKRSMTKTRETMIYTKKAIEDGRIGVIFPSGRLAKRRGLKLHERPWMASAAAIARKFDLPVIPLNIQARNSVLFYLFDLVHPTIRDITLFHETLNKARQPYRITIGPPIEAASLPVSSEEGIGVLRDATLALGGESAPAVSLIGTSRHAGWA